MVNLSKENNSNIVEIEISGKICQLSCQKGEEEHILSLSKELNTKAENLAKKLGDNANENTLSMVLSLTLADEIKKLDKRLNEDSKTQKILTLQKKLDNVIGQLEGLKSANAA